MAKAKSAPRTDSPAKRARRDAPACAEAAGSITVQIHPELKDFVGYSLTKLGLRIRQRMEELLAAEQLVAPQCGVLRLLESVGPMTQGEIAQHMLMDKATMVRMIDGLESAGYALRKEHAVDRRAKVLTITARGSKVLEKVRAARIEAEGAVLSPLDAKERAEFKRLLSKLATPSA